MQHDLFQTIDPATVRITRDYLMEHGKVAGFTLVQFDAALDSDSEVFLRDREDMVQSIYDQI